MSEARHILLHRRTYLHFGHGRRSLSEKRRRRSHNTCLAYCRRAAQRAALSQKLRFVFVGQQSHRAREKQWRNFGRLYAKCHYGCSDGRRFRHDFLYVDANASVYAHSQRCGQRGSRGYRRTARGNYGLQNFKRNRQRSSVGSFMQLSYKSGRLVHFSAIQCFLQKMRNIGRKNSAFQAYASNFFSSLVRAYGFYFS